MSDIGARLLQWPLDQFEGILAEDMQAAADEIARLRARVAELEAALRKCANYIANTEDELGIELGCGVEARRALNGGGDE